MACRCPACLGCVGRRIGRRRHVSGRGTGLRRSGVAVAREGNRVQAGCVRLAGGFSRHRARRCVAGWTGSAAAEAGSVGSAAKPASVDGKRHAVYVVRGGRGLEHRCSPRSSGRAQRPAGMRSSVQSVTAFTASTAVGSRVAGPRASATLRRYGSGSTTRRSAPARRAATATSTPIGPPPTTKAFSPVRSCARRTSWTATAVGSAGAACSSERAGGSRTSVSAGTVQRDGSDPVASIPRKTR